jgi:uncharacterized protein YqjF (DUF2071 family)
MRFDDLLSINAHRPYPLPTSTRIGTMTWDRLLFAHWALPAKEVRAVVPRSLDLDLWDGRAFLGVVPFYMRNVGPRGLNNAPHVSHFAELNVRTYVRHGRRSGVFFFSLDAERLAAVVAARIAFRLPYFWAAMDVGTEDGWVVYRSRRRPGGAASFRARYRPEGPPFQAARESLEAWLVERYCLFTTDARGRVYRGDIHHLPWQLRRPEAEIFENTVVEAAGLRLPATPPILHFADSLDVLAWPLVLDPGT